MRVFVTGILLLLAACAPPPEPPADSHVCTVTPYDLVECVEAG